MVHAVGSLGPRFADYVVVDGEYVGAPFLHAVNRVGLHVVARLKSNLPQLLAAVGTSIATAKTGWRSGMRTTLTPGMLCTGKRYASSADTNLMAWSSKRNG